MGPIKILVVKFGDRKYLQLQYTDPISGKKRTRSAKTTNRREAERAAARWEAEILAGKAPASGKMLWTAFRERYESEVVSGFALETAKKIATGLDLVESILNPTRIGEITSESLSRWIVEMKKEKPSGKSRSIATVAIYCRHLKAALNWAAEMNFIGMAPKMRIPETDSDSKLMKGRPIVLEEHERIREAATKIFEQPYVARWQRFLDGLWWSGLRISEAVKLSWDAASDVSVFMQPGYRPAIRFTAKGQKSKRSELVPCAPEFAEMLESTTRSERTGFVFNLATREWCQRPVIIHVGRMIAQCGAKAAVLVDEDTGKFASAHDYRRAFGTRWSKRVMPAVLKRIMRHKDIATTLRYYVDSDVEDVARDLWEAYERVKANNSTNISPKDRENIGEI